MKTRISLLATLTLVGCANGQLQLPPLPALPSAAPQQRSLTSMGGQTRAISVTVPAGVCNPSLYVSAYLTGYAAGWNDQVYNTQVTSGAQGAAFNTLQSRKLVAPQTPMQSGLTLQQNECNVNSQTAGLNDGRARGNNDYLAAPAS